MAAIYKPTEAIQLLRCATKRPLTIPRKRHPPRLALSTSQTAQASSSSHSSSNSSSKDTTPSPQHPILSTRRQVTVTNDTGAVRWTDLSPGEKAARTVQQSFNFSLVIVGVVLTGAVGYFLFSDVISPNSKTAHFNRATDLVRAHPECQKLLGPGGQISAHGENSWSRWARNRFISSTKETDQWGTEHFKFRFFVEGPLGQGVAHAHLTKRPSQSEYEWYMLAVDVKGHQRVWVENADAKKGSKVAPKIFGARWW